MEVLSRRALNRALLARQLLLERAPLTVAAGIEHREAKAAVAEEGARLLAFAAGGGDVRFV